MTSIHEEIRQALEQATTGPWLADGKLVFDETIPNRHIAKIVQGGVGSEIRELANAHLIANAPTWLKQLLEENERLKESDFQAHSKHHDFIDEIENLESKLNTALEALEDLLNLFEISLNYASIQLSSGHIDSISNHQTIVDANKTLSQLKGESK